MAKAVVYTQAEHRIEKSRLDPDALRIVERLRENGHEAYIVGGAVRDLLLGRKPKDFDIVTDAQPARIKRVFRNARVIGRRFRLVHVYAGSKIFEVSTFRSIANGSVGNEFGTMDEDAFRRDFTLNALYYDPIEAVLVDYVGGFKDIGAKRIKPVIALKDIFREDPVRMIRCAKYAATTGFAIPFATRRAIRRDASLLSGASPSRLTEEFVKILGSGVSSLIIPSLAKYKLLGHIVPEAAAKLDADSGFRAALRVELADLDEEARDSSKEKKLSRAISAFLVPFLLSQEGLVVDSPTAYAESLQAARAFLNPLNLPRVELEAALLLVFARRGISPSYRSVRDGDGDGYRPRRRRRKPAEGERAGEAGPGQTQASPKAGQSGRSPSPKAEGNAAGGASGGAAGGASGGANGSAKSGPGSGAPRSRSGRGGQSKAGQPKAGTPKAPPAEAGSGPEGPASAAKKRRRRRRSGKPSDSAATGE